jgi:hypothetical protein
MRSKQLRIPRNALILILHVKNCVAWCFLSRNSSLRYCPLGSRIHISKTHTVCQYFVINISDQRGQLMKKTKGKNRIILYGLLKGQSHEILMAFYDFIAFLNMKKI